MGAVIALARSVGVALARRGPGGVLRRGLGLLPAVGAGIGGVAAGEAIFGDGDEVPRRRRRRKALTDNDIRQALIIASSISKKAAENFVLMRVKGQ